MNGSFPVAEALGERILYSADAAILVPELFAPALDQPGSNIGSIENNHSIQNTATENPAPTLVVLDARLEDLDILIGQLPQQDNRQTIVDYLVLDPDENGLAQISDVLSEAETSYGSVQIYSHGQAGSFDLGAVKISGDTLEAYAPAFESWKQWLTESADLLIFGCSLTQDAAGLALIDQLALLTGADVAASDNATGHQSLGGDWVLEDSTGTIETQIALNETASQQWLHTLDASGPSAPQQVNVTLIGNQQFDNLSGARKIASNGSSVVVVWTDTSTGNISFQRYDTNGVKQGSELAIANPLGVTRSSPAIAMNASGEFVITWTSQGQDGDSGGIYAQRFQANGTPYGQPAAALSGTYSNPNEFRVNRETGSDQQISDVALFDDGRFIITWRSLDTIGANTTTNIRFAIFDNSGEHITTVDEFASADTAINQSAPVVAIENGSGTAVIAFEQENASGTNPIAYTKLDATGVISDSGTIAGSGFSNTSRPGIAMNDSGRFVITWNETIIGIDSSWLKIFSPDLNAGNNQLVAPSQFTDQPNGKVDIDSNGNLVGVWQNRGSGDYDVYARQLDAQGAAVGGRILISSDNTGDQVAPDVVIHGATATAVYSGESLTDSAGINLSTFSFTPVGAIVVLPNPQETVENGGNVTINLALQTEPVGDVTVTATVSDTSEATLDQVSRTYNPGGNWATLLPFQLNPVDDLLSDGDIPYTVTFSFSSVDDTAYNALPDLVYDFVNIDDETAPVPVGPVTDVDAAANSVDENSAPLAAVGITASATDPNAIDTVSYSISNDPSGFFEIDAATGVVRLAAGASLNASSNASHSIEVQATSSDTSTSTAVFTILVTSAPQPIGPVADNNGAPDQVAENDSGSNPVGYTALAVDPNSADSVTYSIESDPSGNFVIDSATGVVSTVASPGLDFESAGSHTIRVRATSSDGSLSEQDVTITVTDVNEPLGPQSDSNPAANRLSEASPDLTPVGITANATDPDAGDNVSYLMLSDPSGNFEVDATTGVVRLRTGASLDAVANPSHTITVRAVSTDATVSDQTYTIQVDSAAAAVGPVSDSDIAPDEVAENSAPGTPVGYTAQATDPNAGDTVSFSITSDPSGFFQIDSASGVISVAPGAALDYETATQHVLQVQALSSDSSTSLSSPIINVLDVNEPVTITSNGGGASADIQLPDNQQNVTIVQATDPESVAPTYWINGGVDAAFFTIDLNSGLLAFIAPQNVGSPNDNDGDSIYEVTVMASDGVNQDTQSLRVGVGVDPAGSSVSALTDVDGAPDRVDENSAAGMPVGLTASATDTDVGDSVSYSIISDPSSNFQIDPVTGVITTAPGNSLDYESATQHTIRVRATSTDTSFSEADFVIDVDNLAETPVITSNGGGANADITLADGTSAVTTVQASDPDNLGITYSIVGGADASLLTIDSNSGQLRFVTPPSVANPQDAGLNSVYDVVVRASDGFQSDQQTLRIGVGASPNSPDSGWSGPVSLNEDETIVLNNAMLFTDPANAAQLQIDLSVEAGTFTLGQSNGLTFLQGDGVADGAMRFTGTPADIIAALAQVTYQPQADSASNPLASFTVSDPGDPSRFDQALNRFQINPVNDAPAINGSLLAQSTDAAPVSLSASIITANDPDGHAANSLVYRVQNSPASGTLLLNGSALSTGQTFTQADINAGRLSYQADDAATGQDTFGLVLSDPAGANSSVATVMIELVVTEAPPVNTPDDNAPDDIGENNATADEPSAAESDGTVGEEVIDSNPENATAPVAAAPDQGYSRAVQTGPGAEATVSNETAASSANTQREAVTAINRGTALAYAVNYENPGYSSIQTSYQLPASDLVVQRDYRIDQIGFASSQFQRGLASLEDDLQLASRTERTVVASSIAVSSGLSIGYVLWLLRSGALLSSVLASIPAWRSIDPLPILSAMPATDGNAGDDDSLESMLERADQQRQSNREEAPTAEPNE